MSIILSCIANSIMHFISSMSYFGITILMAIESANIPLPSEIIMPFSGNLVFTGIFNLWWVAFYGALGCVIGSIISWLIGYWGGRPLLNRYGKYILISQYDLDKVDYWFKKYGDLTVFIGRLLPIVRTYISLPAGIAKMRLDRFIFYTFVGSFIWCLLLSWIGLKLGANWESIRKYFHGLDWVIVGLIIIGIIWYIWRHVRNNKIQNSNVK